MANDSDFEQKLTAIILQSGKKITREQIEIWAPKMINHFLKIRDASRPLYVNLCTKKIGSEQWVYLLVRDLIPEHKILNKPEDLDKTESIDILFLDDWVLSGSNAVGAWERVMWQHYEKLRDVRYYIRSFVATDASGKLLSETKLIYKNIQVFQTCAMIVDNLSTVLRSKNTYTLTNGQQFTTPWRVNIKDWVSFHHKHNPSSHNEGYLIYSDYKLPNEFGSYPSIYCTVMPEVDREFMKKVEEEYSALL